MNITNNAKSKKKAPLMFINCIAQTTKHITFLLNEIQVNKICTENNKDWECQEKMMVNFVKIKFYK